MSFSLSPPDSLAFICLLLWQIGLTSITMLYEVMVTRGSLITPPRLPKHARTHTVWSLPVFLCLLVHPLCSLISELIALCHPLQCILVLSPSVCSVCVFVCLNPRWSRCCTRLICDPRLAFFQRETCCVSFVGEECVCGGGFLTKATHSGLSPGL